MIEDRVRLRLQFLDRVVQRECTQLQRTANRLFAEPFTSEKAKTLAEDDAFSERVEAFVSRFLRLQDTLGDKLVPLVLSLLGEQQLANIDALDKAERLGWVGSADEWYAIRQLSHLLAH